MKTYDVLIIGAGPAGLSAALALGRVRRTSAIFDSRVFRNAKARFSHNFLTRDHLPPKEMLQIAKSQLCEPKYHNYIHFTERAAVKAAKGSEGTFTIDDHEGQTWTGRKIILAPGCSDQMTDVDGYAELWGTHIIPCPFCDGLEESDGPIGIWADANSPHYVKSAILATNLSDDITIFTHGGPIPEGEITELARKKNFKFETRKVKQFAKDDKAEHGMIVRFDEGEDSHLNFMMHRPHHVINGQFHEQLGLEMTPARLIKVNQVPGPTVQSTSVPGVFAAGDCQNMQPSIATAVASGQGAALSALHTLMA